MAKKFTVIVIPEGTNRVKRFSLPRLMLPLFLVLVVGALGMSGFWFHKYRTLRSDFPDTEALREQTKRQKAQIAAFAGRLASFESQMTKLKTFNHRLRGMADLEKPGNQDAFFGVGGPERHAGGRGVRLTNTADERRLLAMQRKLDHLAGDVEAERQIQEQLAEFLKERRSVLASTPSVWPVRGWVTSGFGYRRSPFTGKRQFHAGLDISTRRGTPIRAPAAGVVTFAGWESGYGKMLVVNHGHGLVTRYGHMNAFKVKVGARVKRGQILGSVGNTGRSTGPHLHYEVLMAGVPTNPRYYILD